MVEELTAAGAVAASAAAVYAMAAARVVEQCERGVAFRPGRLRPRVRGSGFPLVVPFVDRLHKVGLRTVTLPVPAQGRITRDNATVRVGAVVRFRVVDAADALARVEDHRFAISRTARTSLRPLIGRSDLDDPLSGREESNRGLALLIDGPAIGRGPRIDRVEIEDVSLPGTVKRSMARQAGAGRERVITADAELRASKKLSEAAREMSRTPAALRLRPPRTVVAPAAGKNSTLVLPLPVEPLRFLERARRTAPPEAGRSGPPRVDAHQDGGAQEVESRQD